MSVNSFISVAALAAVTGFAVPTASAQITIPTVPIGSPGNAADPTTGYGSVAYTYNIGTTEVTNAQYAAFLNAVAATDTYNLYNLSMAGATGGITRSGNAGAYSYTTNSGRANNPVNFVSCGDAVRFANWLHNGQPIGPQGPGTTETGAYAVNGATTSAALQAVSRGPGAIWALASENEWYKAAYYQPVSAGGDSDSYWLYPTSSNGVPTTAQANIFGNGINNTVPVGSYAANFSGTFDMGGNVWELNEALIGSFRGQRGGSFFNNDASFLPATFRASTPQTFEVLNVGFRVVQIPGPSSVALLAIDGIAATGGRRRRGTC